jgi:Helix-turn-helix domain
VIRTRSKPKSTLRPYENIVDEDEPKPQTPKTHPCDAVGCAEAAKFLGVSRKTLTNWRSLGIGPPYLKYGSRLGPVRYRVDDLAEWQEAHLQTPELGGGSHA